MSSEDDTSPRYVPHEVCPYFVHTLNLPPTLAEISRRMQIILDHPKGGRTTPSLWDIRQTSLSNLTLDSSLNYTQNRPQSGLDRANAKTCAVVSHKNDYATMRQLYSLLDLDSDKTAIFYDYDEAVTWLTAT